MRLTKFTDYSLRVLMYLGAHSDERLATIGEIAASYGISQNHLMKVVHHLAKQGYVETSRGHGGGMRLARAPQDINIGDVVRGAEEDLAVVECFQIDNRNCPIMPVCELRSLLEHAVNAFVAVLDRKTLADLTRSQSSLLKSFASRRRHPSGVPD